MFSWVDSISSFLVRALRAAGVTLFLLLALAGGTVHAQQFAWWDFTGEGNPNNLMDPSNWRWCNYTDYPHAGNQALDPQLTGFGHAAASDFSTTLTAGDTLNARCEIDGSSQPGGSKTINVPSGSNVFFGYNGDQIDGGVTINIDGGSMTMSGNVEDNAYYCDALLMNNLRAAGTQTQLWSGSGYKFFLNSSNVPSTIQVSNGGSFTLNGNF